MEPGQYDHQIWQELKQINVNLVAVINLLMSVDAKIDMALEEPPVSEPPNDVL